MYIHSFWIGDQYAIPSESGFVLEEALPVLFPDSGQGPETIGRDVNLICFIRFSVFQAQLIDPALKGTMNVLGSCAKVPSVERVVVTSSMASVAFNGKHLAPDVLVDESWFSDPVFCEKSKLWYMLSKTLAEEAAWKFAKENGIDMVTINPGWVIGPLLQPTLNLSVEEVLKLLKGTLLQLMRISFLSRLVWKDPWTVKGLKACICNYYPELELNIISIKWGFPKSNSIANELFMCNSLDQAISCYFIDNSYNNQYYLNCIANMVCFLTSQPLLPPTNLPRDTFPNKIYRWVDVRDVAMAHIQAYELPTARGRYCLVGSILHCSETMKIL
ncbi:hypothetical protein AAG906_004784 [Vitis piasezkii]